MDCRQLYGYKRPQLYPTAPCTYLPVKLFFCKYHLSEPMDSCVGMSLNIHSPIPSEELKHAFCISSFSEYAPVDPNTLSVMEQNEQTNKQTNKQRYGQISQSPSKTPLEPSGYPGHDKYLEETYAWASAEQNAGWRGRGQCYPEFNV